MPVINPVFSQVFKAPITDGNWQPTNLFTAGTVGFWYDPSDLSTLFQDNLGNTPVTAPNQTVGLMLDKSQGLVLGTERISNGDFSSGTGWTVSGGWSIGSGVAAYTGSGVAATMSQGVTVVAGSFYQVTFTLVVSSGSFTPRFSGGTTVSGTARTTSGTYTGIIQTATGNNLFQMLGSATAVGSVDNISVKLLAGNHATQATSTQRPIYGINPITGTRNLLTYTEQFDNAAWTKSNATITADTAVAPDGTTTADSILDTAVSNIHYCAQSMTALSPSGKTYTVSAYGKANTLNYMTLGISDVSSGSLYATAVFNLSTGAVSTSGAAGTGYSVVSSSISSVGSGWYRCVVTVVAGTSVSFLRAVVAPNKAGTISAGAGGQQSYLGDGSGFYAWGAQLEQASAATAYQKVVSQYEVTEAGVASVSYLAFDGVDDNLVIPSLSLTGTESLFLCFGAQRLSTTSNTALMTFGKGGNTTTYPGFASLIRGSSAPAYAPQLLTASATVASSFLAVTGNTFGDAATRVLSATRTALRVNASALAITGSTVNFDGWGTQNNRLGCNYNFANNQFWKGNIYSAIFLAGAVTAGQITSAETYVNGKTGAY